MLNKKLIAFDMDGTLINGRLVFALGDRFGFSGQINKIMNAGILGYKKSEKIARLWKGLTPDDIVDGIANIPLMRGAEEVIKELKKRGYKVGIISDSYTLATGYMAKKLDLDFHLANVLIEKDGLLTGKLCMLLGWDKIDCDCKISVCKRFHLEKVAKLYDIALKDTVAIGDTKSDLCMIKRAGIGIAFNPKDEVLTSNIDKVVKELNMNEIFQYLKRKT
jgi:phosphoserine phosphatase